MRMPRLPFRLRNSKASATRTPSRAPAGKAVTKAAINWRLLLGRSSSLIWLLLAAAALTWGVWGLWTEMQRKAPLAMIQVEGDISAADREELSQRLSQVQGSYFTTDLVAIRDAVLTSPWVESMSVQRRWPDGIRVLVVEKKPVARWGEHNYLSARGEIFQPKPDVTTNGLPLLIGPSGKATYVMEQFRGFNERLRPLGWRVVELHLTERMTWFMRLDSGMAITLDQAQVNDKLQRLLWLYPKVLAPYAERIASIDLRYRNGLAVGWKTGLQVPVVNNQLKPLEQGGMQNGN